MNKAVIWAIAAGLGAALAGGMVYNRMIRGEESYRDKLSAVLPTITAAPPAPAEISAWVAWWDEENTLESLENNNNRLKRIMPMWYRLNKQGELQPISESKLNKQIEEKARSKFMEIMPTITNEFDPEATSALLDSPDKQIKLIDEMVYIARANGFVGWDIDWEEMYPGDRGGFSYFVREAAAKLHENNLKLSITIQARTDEITENPATKAQDWRIIGSHADEVRIMAYDFHYSDSEPGAVTPINKLERVIQVALRELPTEKIIMGMPTYGYKWSGGKGVAVQYNEAVKIIADNKLNPKRDEKSAALTVNFRTDGANNEMWYEDSESMRVKIILCQAAGISRFSLWRLGGEDRGIWEIK